MTAQTEWEEFLNSTVTVGGVQKRMRDCTPEEVDSLRDEAARQRDEIEEELTELRRARDWLWDQPHGTKLRDSGYFERDEEKQ